MKKKKDNTFALAILIIGIVAMLVIGLVIFSQDKKSKDLIEVGGYYDQNGNKILTSLAVVNGVEGVQYISLNINALNKDTVPLNFEIVGLSPTEFETQIQSSIKIADPNKYATWESGLIDISNFVGTNQTFEVSVKASAEGLREPITKASHITLSIKPNPDASFDIDVEAPGLEDSEFPQTTLPFGIPDLSIYDQINRETVSRNLNGQISYEKTLILGANNQLALEISYEGKNDVSAGEFGGTFAVIYPTGINSIDCDFSNSDPLPSDMFGTNLQFNYNQGFKLFSYGITDGIDIPFDGDSRKINRISCLIKNGATMIPSGEFLEFKFIPAGYYLNSNDEYILDTQEGDGSFVMDYHPSIKAYIG